MTCCCHRLTQDRALVVWRRERAAQIDWMDEQTRKGLYPDRPDRPCPPMTVPPPFSPEWYTLPGEARR